MLLTPFYGAVVEFIDGFEGEVRCHDFFQNCVLIVDKIINIFGV